LPDANPQGVRGVMAEALSEALEVGQVILNGRRAFHYQRVFHDRDGKLTTSGERVLADLARFCRANESTFHADPRTHALLEGRREVWLRICGFLGVDSAMAVKFVEVKDE